LLAEGKAKILTLSYEFTGPGGVLSPQAVCGCAVPRAQDLAHWPQHSHKSTSSLPAATHPTVSLLHPYGRCERVSCLYLEKGPFPIARAGCHQVRCRVSRAPPHSPIGKFCISCLSLFSQGFLAFILQAYSTRHCFISCVFSPVAV